MREGERGRGETDVEGEMHIVIGGFGDDARYCVAYHLNIPYYQGVQRENHLDQTFSLPDRAPLRRIDR